ncbi:MAG: M20 family metallopeptidase [Anaerolineae bacterium]|nr:M20 family metallopeptidase [Anaerolineae bacterium]
MTDIDLMQHFESRVEVIVDRLVKLVRLESPSKDKAAVDRMGAEVAAQCWALGAEVTVEPRMEAGDILLAKWNMGAPGKPIVVIGHMDTVWPLGALPVRREGDKLYGPGVYDMKAGIAIFLAVVAELQALGRFPERPIWGLFTGDEETGSTYSVGVIEATARQAGLVVVPEPAIPPEGIKTARKGTGDIVVKAIGRSAHAGGEPEQGINAIVELAHQVDRLAALSDPAVGTTVTPTLITGGVVANAVPAEAELTADVRVPNKAEQARIERALADLTPTLAGARLEIRSRFDRPPMERNALMIQTFEQLGAVAHRIGHPPLAEGSTGGGSDGNFTAALGVPTLDGMGPQGGGAHAVHEHVVVPGLARRAALMAGVLLYWPAL